MDLPKPDLTEIELRMRAMAAKSTADWLELYSEVVQASIYKASSDEFGIARGNIMEQIRDWRADWKKVAIELSAIELNALEEVELQDEPRMNPATNRYVIKPEGMSVYWPSRGDKPIVFKQRAALSVFHFFSWLISFKDTIAPPKSRLGGNIDISGLGR